MNLLFLGRVFTLIALFSLSVNVFAASPRINYLLYCTGCHAANGAGKPPNVPSLRDELGRMISVPEMRSYLVRIPGASQAPISDADLTDVINWLLREFNSNPLPANFEEYTVGEVSNARRNILADPLRYRAEHWKSYDD